MRRLNCAVQNYAWGKRGSQSKVAKLKMLENEGFETDEDKTYAELWMGTHPNGPSRVMPEAGDFVEGAEEGHAGIFLIELLETHPHYLGDLQEVGDLPFMFKVLSINKALSIQVIARGGGLSVSGRGYTPRRHPACPLWLLLQLLCLLCCFDSLSLESVFSCDFVGLALLLCRGQEGLLPGGAIVPNCCTPTVRVG